MTFCGKERGRVKDEKNPEKEKEKKLGNLNHKPILHKYFM